ncbi:MAG: endonuclease III [Deltaproteobacteria bacterium]|nr:endonuclease III [Deltaproteobacteria bacterium]
MKKSERNQQILQGLAKLFPNPDCALIHDGPFQLLIATILSAQCTDERVNMVTPPLFAKYPTPEKMAHASLQSLETLVKSTGFYRAKAKSLQSTAQDIVSRHHGQVPNTMHDLIQLRGVGRKTANVVLGNAFGKNVGVVVDTHVGRLSRKFGFTKHKDPIKVEKDLMKLVPQEDWTVISHRMIMHGRTTCKARKPLCGVCKLHHLCPSALV